jgi:hypothetical protein
VNKAGPSDPSPASSSVRPFGAPGQIASVQASEEDSRSTLTFAAPSDNGKTIARYEYRINGGAPGVLGANRVVGGLANGQTYRFDVRACNDFCGEWSPQSNAAVPYGPVGQPGISASGGATTVTFNWSPPAPNGRPIDRLEISINGGDWEKVSPGAGGRTVGNGYDQTWTLRVMAIDRAKQGGPENSASARTGPAPPPPARNYAVADSFLGGTCLTPGPHGGSWLNSGTCGGAGGQWVGNGTSVAVVCALQGPSYTVSYVGGGTQTWNWHARLNNGRYARAAPLWANNNNDGNPIC